MRDEIEDQVWLPDGRRLGYRATGPARGQPLFYFHGFPGSRREAGLLCQGGNGNGWRTFAIDRPGIGLSDMQHGRTLLDWPRDVAEFANALGIERFTTLGVSGGGPYAAVCAWALPERVRAAGIVCGMGQISDPESITGMHQLNRGALQLLRHLPSLSGPAFGPMALLLKHWPLALLDGHSHALPKADQEALQRPDVRRVLSDSFREAVRQGSGGGAQELKIYCRAWGFSLDSIRVPVCIWHGELDTLVPCEMGRRLASRIPKCRASFFPDHGHYSLLIGKRRAEILAALYQAQSG